MIAEAAPAAGEVRFDEMEGEGVVAGGHRRMRGEDGRAPHFRERRGERVSALQELVDALQHHEAGVPLVEMPHRRIDAERPQGADAADAEDDFLLDARFAVAAVEARREFAVPRRVLFEVGVEEIDLRVTELDVPHRDEHGARAERDGDDARLAVGHQGRFDRRVLPVQLAVAFFLPAFRRHALVEVALRIHEADGDERHAEVAGFLAVIAGEHAQAARVDRQRLMEGEFG